jgi:hypothetical protein
MLTAALVLLSAAATRAQQPPALAGATRKHLQVLQDVPESQLFLVMNAVSQSLDVHCDYCHVKVGDKWQWERDDKPKKAAALKMMKMVVGLNAANFDGSTTVTCFTCHRGSIRPAMLVPMPPHDALNPAANPALPSPAAVLDAYYAAVGGRDAAAAMTSLILRGTDERSEGRITSVEYDFKGADKIRVSRETVGQPPLVQAADGPAGWNNVGGQVQTLTADQVQQFRRGMAVFAPVKVAEPAQAMKVEGLETIAGRTTFVVSATTAPGVTVRYFFDTRTGLLTRQLTATARGIVQLQDQIDFEDYRDVSGLKFPFTIRISNVAPYDTSIRRFTEIRHGIPVDDALFTRR